VNLTQSRIVLFAPVLLAGRDCARASGAMTIAETVGQMAQADGSRASPGEIRGYRLGSITDTVAAAGTRRPLRAERVPGKPEVLPFQFRTGPTPQ
jgi:hypothetical protein